MCRAQRHTEYSHPVPSGGPVCAPKHTHTSQGKLMGLRLRAESEYANGPHQPLCAHTPHPWALLQTGWVGVGVQRASFIKRDFIKSSGSTILDLWV